jgi:hypothetical protein
VERAFSRYLLPWAVSYCTHQDEATGRREGRLGTNMIDPRQGLRTCWNQLRLGTSASCMDVRLHLQAVHMNPSCSQYLLGVHSPGYKREPRTCNRIHDYSLFTIRYLHLLRQLTSLSGKPLVPTSRSSATSNQPYSRKSSSRSSAPALATSRHPYHTSCPNPCPHLVRS